MKKSRFSESQMVGILKEIEVGAKVNGTYRKHGISEPTICKILFTIERSSTPKLAGLAKSNRRR